MVLSKHLNSYTMFAAPYTNKKHLAHKLKKRYTNILQRLLLINYPVSFVGIMFQISLAIQWLGVGTVTAVDPGRGQGTKIPQVVQHSQKKKSTHYDSHHNYFYYITIIRSSTVHDNNITNFRSLHSTYSYKHLKVNFN